MAEEQQEKDSTIQQMVRQHLPTSICKAMQSAVAATGRLPDTNGTVQSLKATLMEITPYEDWELSVPAEEYDRMAQGEPPETDRKKLIRQGRNDQKKISRTAANLHNRTKRAIEE